MADRVERERRHAGAGGRAERSARTAVDLTTAHQNKAARSRPRRGSWWDRRRRLTGRWSPADHVDAARRLAAGHGGRNEGLIGAAGRVWNAQASRGAREGPR